MSAYRGKDINEVLDSIDRAIEILNQELVPDSNAARWLSCLETTGDEYCELRALGNLPSSNKHNLHTAAMMEKSYAKYMFFPFKDILAYRAGVELAENPIVGRRATPDVDCYRELMRWGAFIADKSDATVNGSNDLFEIVEQDVRAIVVEKCLARLTERDCEPRLATVERWQGVFGAMGKMESEDGKAGFAELPHYRALHAAGLGSVIAQSLARPENRALAADLCGMLTRYTGLQQQVGELDKLSPLRSYSLTAAMNAEDQVNSARFIDAMGQRVHHMLDHFFALSEVAGGLCTTDRENKTCRMALQMTGRAAQALANIDHGYRLYDDQNILLKPHAPNRPGASSWQPGF